MSQPLFENLQMKSCTSCGTPKPVDCFYRRRHGLSSWCKACFRQKCKEYRKTKQYRETIKGYLSKPEVKERKREIDRERSESRRVHQKRYRSTPRARLLHSRRAARIRLRKATDPERRRKLKELIAMYETELKRIEKVKTKE